MVPRTNLQVDVPVLQVEKKRSSPDDLGRSGCTEIGGGGQGRERDWWH